MFEYEFIITIDLEFIGLCFNFDYFVGNQKLIQSSKLKFCFINLVRKKKSLKADQ